MFKRYVLVLIIVFASIALVYHADAANEDTVQIKLKKTAIARKNLYTYTVKEGDILLNIIKQIPGTTEKDILTNYQLIKELNPHIPDINNLEVGQSVFLPGKPSTAEDSPKSKTVSTSVEKSPSPKNIYYTIKKGDTLYKIVRREYKVAETGIPRMIRTIKAINPRVRNINRIFAGTVIKLPGKTVFVKSADETVLRTDALEKLSGKSIQAGKIIEIKDKKSMPPEVRLALLKHIITQMNGTFTATGNYYLPLPQAGQITIDCSKMPLIEFDDNTTIFLDLENRAHKNLKKIISNNWKNYHLVKADINDDTIGILRKIMSATKKYNLIKSERPLTFGALPPVEVMVDWLIVKPIPGQQSQAIIQGLRLIYDNNLLLPNSIKNYAQKNGLIITEFSEETGMMGKPEELYSLPPVSVFPTTTAKDFSYALATYLGLNAEKDVEIQIFDSVKDGFNLSLKADVLISKENKKYVIYSQSLSQQFTNALKQAGHDTIFISDGDSPKNILANILSGLDIPFHYGSHTFAGLEKNQAPYALKFNGTKINENLYVVNFDMDPGLRGLLQEVWSVQIARY